MNFSMKLRPEPFLAIREGRKTIELRLYDEKRRAIRPGDSITFQNTESGECITARVRALHLFDSFDALYRSLSLIKCGYTEDTVAAAMPADMEAYYSPEEQAAYGVVGIELEKI